MIRKAGEAHHNTPEEVRGWLLDAIAVVSELEVPKDLRVAAFEKAYASLSAKQITYEQLEMTAGSLLGNGRG